MRTEDILKMQARNNYVTSAYDHRGRTCVNSDTGFHFLAFDASALDQVTPPIGLKCACGRYIVDSDGVLREFDQSDVWTSTMDWAEEMLKRESDENSK